MKAPAPKKVRSISRERANELKVQPFVFGDDEQQHNHTPSQKDAKIIQKKNIWNEIKEDPLPQNFQLSNRRVRESVLSEKKGSEKKTTQNLDALSDSPNRTSARSMLNQEENTSPTKDPLDGVPALQEHHDDQKNSYDEQKQSSPHTENETKDQASDIDDDFGMDELANSADKLPDFDPALQDQDAVDPTLNGDGEQAGLNGHVKSYDGPDDESVREFDKSVEDQGKDHENTPFENASDIDDETQLDEVTNTTKELESEELEIFKKEAWQQGYEAGIKDEKKNEDIRMTNLLGALHSEMNAIILKQDALIKAMTPEILQLVTTVLERLSPHFVKQHGVDDIGYIIYKALEHQIPGSHLKICVSPDFVEPLTKLAEDIEHSKHIELEIVADDTLQAGDLHVEWKNGRIKRDFSEISNQLFLQLKEHLDALKALQNQPESQPNQQDEASPKPD
ncbi:MAG: hypothetical protein AAF403_03265 [Pseudomonadota bacterium]